MKYRIQCPRHGVYDSFGSAGEHCSCKQATAAPVYDSNTFHSKDCQCVTCAKFKRNFNTLFGFDKEIGMCDSPNTYSSLNGGTVQTVMETTVSGFVPCSDSRTEGVVCELRRVRAALEVVAGRPTPTSIALGKAISELCFQDVDRKGKTTALKDILRFGDTAYRIERIVKTELTTNRRS